MRGLFVTMSVLSLFIFPLSAHAATTGRLVKIHSDSAVYYTVNGKRYAFPHESVFFSWYSDFHSVATISPDELTKYTLVGNVTYRPGTWLVKIQTDPKVYAVSRFGTLRWVASEHIAATLYGSKWQTNVRDIPDTFFLNYDIGNPITNATEYSVEGELAITQISQNIKGPDTSVDANIRMFEEKAVSQINAYRISKGLSALTPSDEIATIARAHSTNIAAGTVPFGHQGFNERFDLIAKVMTIELAAENVAYNMNASDPIQTAVKSWIESPGHLINIENSSYNRTGVGIAIINETNEYYLTQLFAKELPTL